MSNDVPIFNGTNYVQYKRLATMWSTITTVKEENKTLTLIMKIKGKAIDLALNIDETLLKTMSTEANKAANPVVGVEFLISKLDEV